MDGKMNITYKVLCDGDFNERVTLAQILENEKISKLIKSEYAKGYRNLSLSSKDDAAILVRTEKKLYSFEVEKDDFADILTLAEEDATNKKLLKKECNRIELVDIKTL